nr:putative periplasmic pilus exported chaperone [Serratia symbiotica]
MSKTVIKFLMAAAMATAALLTGVQQASAAIALDRTRIIFGGENHSISLNLSNQNRELPYLAQGWIEDDKGNKIESPLMVLPPLQRVEPGGKSQVKIQATSAINALPQDHESLFYFNLREIPPRSEKPNMLQIALQTRIKLFFRPAKLQAGQNGYSGLWQQKLTLTREGDKYRITNPTPYFVTIVAAQTAQSREDIASFNPLMIAPQSSALLNLSAKALGSSPVLTYINDFGGRPKLIFNCNAATCSVKENLPG